MGLRSGPRWELTALPHQTALLVGRGLAAPPQEHYPHFRPFGPQPAALRALLNQCPGIKKSKCGHPRPTL